jgi:hypothetical protein
MESLTEYNDTSEDGVLYFSTRAVSVFNLDSRTTTSMNTQAANLTWQTDAYYLPRSGFLVNGSLTNTNDTRFRPISSYVVSSNIPLHLIFAFLIRNTPVMSFALDLGNVTSPADPVVFTLGLVRDPVLTYLRGKSVHNRLPLWLNQWSSVDEGVGHFPFCHFH